VVTHRRGTERPAIIESILGHTPERQSKSCDIQKSLVIKPMGGNIPEGDQVNSFGKGNNETDILY
jgi:hypothetical protein